MNFKINAQLSDDREKLAAVIFRWLEQTSSVAWADIALICKQTWFNQLSEAINKAYKSCKYDCGSVPSTNSIIIIQS